MYIVGQEEIDAIAKVIREGALFRYGIGSECDRFEERYAEYLGTAHVALTCSGTYALTAAVTALGIGPGGRGPGAGAYLHGHGHGGARSGRDPGDRRRRREHHHRPGRGRRRGRPADQGGDPGPHVGCRLQHGPRSWRSRTDSTASLVLEDTCQGIGGGYEGRQLGTIGHAGAFSFNYYKNMTAGEGGAVCTDDPGDRRAGQVRDRSLPLLLAGPE